jgi:hypothetical protein
MLLTLDNLANRYNCLPSQALANGTTFDLHVLDVSAKWSKRQNDIAEGKSPQSKVPTQSEMVAMIERVKERKDDPT